MSRVHRNKVFFVISFKRVHSCRFVYYLKTFYKLLKIEIATDKSEGKFIAHFSQQTYNEF